MRAHVPTAAYAESLISRQRDLIVLSLFWIKKSKRVSREVVEKRASPSEDVISAEKLAKSTRSIKFVS